MRVIGVALLTLAAFAVGVYLLDPEIVRAALNSKQGVEQAAAPARGGSERGNGGAGPVAVTTAVADTRDVPVTETTVGWVEPIASVDVRPQISGTIVEQAIAEGQTVAAGDLLFKLDDQPIQAALARDQATIAKDQAALDQAKADLGRDKSLAGHQLAVTEQQIEQQQATVSGDAAQVEMDRAAQQADQVQLAYATIRSPIAGRAGAVNRTPGNYVQAGDQTALVTITQMAPVRVTFTLPERELAPLRAAIGSSGGKQVRVTIPGATQPTATGKLSFINPLVDTGSGTVTAKADFDNADGALWPGQYLSVEVELGRNGNATVVPMVAIQESDSGPFVFVVRPDHTVDKQAVTVGTAAGDNIVVASGIKPGDHVVVDGQLRLQPGATAKETISGASAATASQ